MKQRFENSEVAQTQARCLHTPVRMHFHGFGGFPEQQPEVHPAQVRLRSLSVFIHLI
jgi:hypothetical protein